MIAIFLKKHGQGEDRKKKYRPYSVAGAAALPGQGGRLEELVSWWRPVKP